MGGSSLGPDRRHRFARARRILGQNCDIFDGIEHSRLCDQLPEADDAVLDALEEQFEGQGVKDIRGDASRTVTIRMEDENTLADAGPACSAVRTAGFSEIVVDIDDVVSQCP